MIHPIWRSHMFQLGWFNHHLVRDTWSWSIFCIYFPKKVAWRFWEVLDVLDVTLGAHHFFQNSMEFLKAYFGGWILLGGNLKNIPTEILGGTPKGSPFPNFQRHILARSSNPGTPTTISDRLVNEFHHFFIVEFIILQKVQPTITRTRSHGLWDLPIDPSIPQKKHRSPCLGGAKWAAVSVVRLSRFLNLPGKHSIHFFRPLWLVLGVKLMEINSNLFSRYWWKKHFPAKSGGQ